MAKKIANCVENLDTLATLYQFDVLKREYKTGELFTDEGIEYEVCISGMH
nr:hypothetical protein [Mycobacterium sp. E3298]